MDKSTEQRVWRRVYGEQTMPARHTPRQKQGLEQALRRTQANLRFYEQREKDPVYGEAFSHLARQTAEHCKMLRRIMEG